MVQSWWAALLIGVTGGLIPEVLVVIAALRAGRPLVRGELVAGLMTGALGAGVLLFGWHSRQPIDLAVQGAAFPALFAGLVRAATQNDDDQTRDDAQAEELAAIRETVDEQRTGLSRAHVRIARLAAELDSAHTRRRTLEAEVERLQEALERLAPEPDTAPTVEIPVPPLAWVRPAQRHRADPAPPVPPLPVTAMPAAAPRSADHSPLLSLPAGPAGPPHDVLGLPASAGPAERRHSRSLLDVLAWRI